MVISPEIVEQIHSEEVNILDQYDAPYQDQQVLVLASDDWRVRAAFEIELFNMTMLGDPQELAEQDLIHGFNRAKFLAVYGKLSEPGRDNMLGVVRITPPDTDGTIGTLEEISRITGDDYSTVFDHLSSQTGEADAQKVFDITTYGMSPNVWEEAESNKDLFQGTKYNLMYAMSREGIRAHQKDGATTAVAYFNAFSKDYFINKGYAWEDLNGYRPKADVFVDGKGNTQTGQVVVPTVLSIEKHIERMQSGATKHLGEIAAFMFKDGFYLPEPVTSRHKLVS